MFAYAERIVRKTCRCCDEQSRTLFSLRSFSDGGNEPAQCFGHHQFVTPDHDDEAVPHEGESDLIDPPTRVQFEAEKAEIMASGTPEPVGNLLDTSQSLTTFGSIYAHLDAETNRARLQWRYGVALLWVLVIQVFAADIIFVFVASSNKFKWAVPTAIMNLWIGATVVQVIGIVAIVIRYLFPKDGKAIPGQKKTKERNKK